MFKTLVSFMFVFNSFSNPTDARDIDCKVPTSAKSKLSSIEERLNQLEKK